MPKDLINISNTGLIQKASQNHSSCSHLRHELALCMHLCLLRQLWSSDVLQAEQSELKSHSSLISFLPLLLGSWSGLNFPSWREGLCFWLMVHVLSISLSAGIFHKTTQNPSSLLWLSSVKRIFVDSVEAMSYSLEPIQGWVLRACCISKLF